jgi:uncharacterized SAM-binding protein YcdF (DUF218 family)
VSAYQHFSKRLRFLAWFLAVACALLLACYVFRAPLLTGLAEAWVVDEPGAHADAIVVLGGKPELRPVEAARLYHSGAALRILYMDVKVGPAVEQGLMLSEREFTRRVLLNKGVPETAITAVGARVASTYDESLAVRVHLDRHRSVAHPPRPLDFPQGTGGYGCAGPYPRH